MAEKEKIDLEKWNRKELFCFFRDFAEPFYGMTVELDVTRLYLMCKENGESFFIHSLYIILKAINSNDPLRLRIVEGELYRYKTIHVSPSIAKTDGTFAFAFMKYSEDFGIFRKHMQEEIGRIQNIEGMNLTEDARREDTIHFSAIPWVRFTSLSHARYMKSEESVPKISTGKICKKDDRFYMPFSIHVHHSLVDGKDVAVFLDNLQQLLNK
ncbi:MAG: CatA-like O-acetyltransferase [Bacteroidales bacterium]